MSSSYFPLTISEQDALTWYRLDPEPDEYRQAAVASIPAPSEPPVDDSAEEPIQMPEAA